MIRVALASLVTALACFLAFGIIRGSAIPSPSQPVVDPCYKQVTLLQCQVVAFQCDPSKTVTVWVYKC